MTNNRRLAIVFVAAFFSAVGPLSRHTADAAERLKLQVTSSIDKTGQPCYLILPDDFAANRTKERPLLVCLHTWSGGVEQRHKDFEAEANRRGWLYLFPHFRGPNRHPDACGSLKAQQDILDAVLWVRKRYPIDEQRIYLTGVSGGGHMTMLMAGRHPQLWAAASAWVGISDLASWERRHAKSGYGEMVRKSCGGPPGDSARVDAEYRARSPLTHLASAARLPLDIAAGVHDGHQGSVPIRHSLDAFNVLAGTVQGGKPVTEDEINQLSRKNGRLDKPGLGDTPTDASYGRKIYLRRYAGPSRVTIFEGGHEGIATAAFAWLEKHKLPANNKK